MFSLFKEGAHITKQKRGESGKAQQEGTLHGCDLQVGRQFRLASSKSLH